VNQGGRRRRRRKSLIEKWRKKGTSESKEGAKARVDSVSDGGAMKMAKRKDREERRKKSPRRYIEKRQQLEE